MVTKTIKLAGNFKITRDKIIYVQNYLRAGRKNCNFDQARVDQFTVLFIPVSDGSRYKTNCDFETAIQHFSKFLAHDIDFPVF